MPFPQLWPYHDRLLRAQQEMSAILKFCEVEPGLAGVYISRLCMVIGSLYLLAYLSLRMRLVLVSQSH